MIAPKQLEATVITYPTSANLGPLFDIGGARLNGHKSGLYMETTGHWKKEPGLVIESNGKYPVPIDRDNLAHKVAAKIFHEKGLEGGLVLRFSNYMKPGGLGTSGAGAIAVVEIINKVYGLNLTDEEKIMYAAAGETQEHLDNVMPGVIGGIVISSRIQGHALPRYSKIPAPATITPSLIVPLTISKDGGTAQARAVLDELTYDRFEAVRLTELSQLMTAGLRENNFRHVWDSINDYSRWSKSVTYVRNVNGVYKVDVYDVNRRLEQIVGREAIVTPSGAGTALLILAADHAVALRSRIAGEKIFRDFNKPAAVFETPFF
ncbi:hypothetical protein HY637_01930 [Candidatus Woesearchaeota archaeon]|nr:hypothetical protein [Candidatus Woesearchaeota archaeon]